MLLVPKLDILPEAQKELWPQLKDTPKEFVLYGGTAVALRYGHRQSVDFDFFTNTNMDLHKCVHEISYIKNNPSVEENFQGKQIDFILALHSGKVNVTFLNNPDIMPGCICSPDKILGNNIKIASPLDLMVGKIFAIQRRNEKKDFIDVGELILNGVSLQKGFEAAHAVAKISRLGVSQLYLDRLKEDLSSKSVNKMLSGHEKYIEVIRNDAQKINLARVEKTSLKAKKGICFEESISR